MYTDSNGNNGNSNQILNNEIHDNGYEYPGISGGQSGIYSASGTTGNWYIGNYVHDNGRMTEGPDCNNQPDPTLPNRLDHGLYLSGQSELVVNNLVAGNAMHGIQVFGTSTHPANMQIYNNTIVLNRRGSGIMLYNVMGGVDIANNIFYNNGTLENGPSCLRNYGIDTCIASGSGVQIRNNLFFENQRFPGLHGDWNLCSNLQDPSSCGSPCTITTTPTASVLNTDPAFVNPYGDWHLQSTSGAIAQGVDLYSASPPTDYDYDGNQRGCTYDIGAYAYAANAPFPWAPPGLRTDWNATSVLEQLRASSLATCPPGATALHTRFKLHSDCSWTSGTDCTCAGTVTLASQLSDGDQYDVQVAWGSGATFLSDWSVTQTVTIAH